MSAVRHFLVVTAAAAFLACDAQFVEPNPPVLERFTRVVEHTVVDEPVVVGVILDLHIPDPAECQTAQALVLDSARSFLLGGGQGVELAVQDLAPGCAQPTTRRVDLAAFQDQLSVARSQFGDQRVRPLFFYANNVGLPLNEGLRSDLAALRNTGPSNDRPALLVGVASAAVLVEAFDGGVAWTFTGDPRLRPAIESTARTMIPFRSRSPGLEQELFSAQVAPRVKRYLWCNPSDQVATTGFTAGATAVLDPFAPQPTVRSVLSEAWIEWWSMVQPATFELQFQVCTENCTRFVRDPVSGLHTRWNNLTACLPEESAE